MTGNRLLQSFVLMLTFGSTLLLSGCTPTEETETISALQTALTNLTQNRSLTEQFVRDIKSTTDPSDPAYLQAMESYQDARDQYNRYLDSVESERRRDGERSLRGASALSAQNAAADFLADATRALRPSINTRRVAFQRAVVVPENLQAALSRIPKKAREKLVDQFDSQVRWRSWSQM